MTGHSQKMSAGMTTGVKIILGFLLLAFVVQGAYLVLAKQHQKIGYIKNLEVMKEYKGLDKAKKHIEDLNKTIKNNLDTLQIEFERSLKQFEQDRTKMKPEEKQLAENKLRDKQNRYQQYKEAMQSKLMEEQMGATQDALKGFDAYVQKYAKDHGFSLILGATSNGNVIYAEESIDITTEVIKGANEEYAKK